MKGKVPMYVIDCGPGAADLIAEAASGEQICPNLCGRALLAAKLLRFRSFRQDKLKVTDCAVVLT